MRVLAVIFALLIIALQYPLWFGKGGWLKVREIGLEVQEQKARNVDLKTRNEALDAEVRDLKNGYAAIEERARSELGMVKRDEYFLQINESAHAAGASVAAPSVSPSVANSVAPQAASARSTAQPLADQP